jgi:hypothetical protein
MSTLDNRDRLDSICEAARVRRRVFGAVFPVAFAFAGCGELLSLDAYRVDSGTPDAPPEISSAAAATANQPPVGTTTSPTPASSAPPLDAGLRVLSVPSDAGGVAPPPPLPDAMVQPNDQDAGPAAEESETPPVPVDVGLAVQYRPLNAQPRDNVIANALKIIDRCASSPIPLCALALRYYFTNEHAELCPGSCKIDSFYSGLQPSGATTLAVRTYRAASDSGSAYLEVRFPCTGIYLEPGDSAEVHQQFHTEPYQNFDETDDYSFRIWPGEYADWDHVTLHLDDTLVWGRQP